MKWLIAIVALAIGLGLGWWLGVSHGKPVPQGTVAGLATGNNIHLVVDPFGKVTVAPAAGDKIDWKNYDGTVLTVNLSSYGQGNELCQLGTSKIQTCTVTNTTAGWYPYTCNGVTCDPVITPGSNIKVGVPFPKTPPKASTLPPLAHALPASTTVNGGEYVLVSCSGGQSVISGYTPEFGTPNGNAVSPGEMIVWSAGNSSGTVQVSSGLCTPATKKIPMNQQACTIASNLTYPQTYTFQRDDCSQPGTAQFCLAGTANCPQP